MPAANVTLAETVTPTDLTVDFAAKASQGGQADWDNASKVYTTKDGQKFTIAIEDAVAGQNAKITATPVADFVAGSVTLTFENSGEIGKISFSAGDPSSARGFTTVLAGDATVEISDNTSAAYVLTVPAGIGVSGATPFETNKYLVAAGSVTLTGLSADYYLKADTSYVKDGSANFTMPGNDLEITADKYHKITSVTVDDTTDSNVSTNLGGVTVVAPSNLNNTYVKEGDSVSVTFTLGGTGTVATNPINITMDGLAGLTSGSYATAQELLAVGDTQATDIGSKADTVTVAGVATADFTIAYSLTTNP